VEGCNSHVFNVISDKEDPLADESLISLAGVGASMCNSQSIKKMGDYRERLQWCRSPIVGNGTNDGTGAAATTRPDGSPYFSVQDEAMPVSFFDPKTGDFVDSVHARMAARLNINFGNPFHETRGDSIIPEQFLNQRPPQRGKNNNNDAMRDNDPNVSEGNKSPRTPTGSPPHDMFLSEGEDEARVLLPRLTKRRKKEADNGKDETNKSESSSNKARESSTVDEDSAAPPIKKPPPPPPPSSKKGTPLPAEKSRPPPPPSAAKKPPPPAPGGTQKKPAPPAPQQATMKRDAATATAPPKPKPKEQAPVPVPREAATNTVLKPPQLSESALQNPGSKPDVKLPPGWMTVWSKSQKRWYFFDTKTNKSVWQWPP
jgi:hypothetical protein